MGVDRTHYYCKELQAKLEIATKALEFYANDYKSYMNDGSSKSITKRINGHTAQQALKEIKECTKI